MIHTNDKLQDHIFLKNIVILITCIIKDDGKFYPQLIQRKHFIINKHLKKDRCMSEDEKKEIEQVFTE